MSLRADCLGDVDVRGVTRAEREMPGGPMSDEQLLDTDEGVEEHFKPTGTLFVLGVFVATIVLLWMSVYVILLSRGVTL